MKYVIKQIPMNSLQSYSNQLSMYHVDFLSTSQLPTKLSIKEIVLYHDTKTSVP